MERESLAESSSLLVETYHSDLYRDGDTAKDLRKRVGCMEAIVWYQDFSLNVEAHTDETKLKVDTDKALAICRFIWNPLQYALLEFLKKIYCHMNNLNVGPGHPDRATFEQIGHTSMSVGDFIVLRDLQTDTSKQLWAVAGQGFMFSPL